MLDSLSLGHPWALLFLPLPWLLRKVLPPAKQSATSGIKLPHFATVAPLLRQYHQPVVQKHSSYWLLLLAWGLLVLSLSNPLWLGEPIALPQAGRDLMLAIDLSGSMQVPDMKIGDQEVDRLTAIKSVANKFIQQRQGDRLGLILFGSKAYLQTPLTFDRHTVAYMLDDASIGLAGPQTAIGDAIGLAIKRLQQHSQQSRVLVLLTDGANNSGTATPDMAAQLAAREGIKIYTIGFGADKLIVPGIFGPRAINPSSELDETSLKMIADTTGGQYFRATDTESLDEIYQLLNQLEPVKKDSQIIRPQTSLYPWFLAMALLLSLYLVFRRPLTATFSTLNENRTPRQQEQGT